jgi:hypothetical protein
MTFSLHDNLLVSYEVQCEARRITLRTERRLASKPTEFTNVIFEGVQGYRFENDAFGNIIFDLERVPVEHMFPEWPLRYRSHTEPPAHRALGLGISSPLLSIFAKKE